jgi:hypothetical protein
MSEDTIPLNAEGRHTAYDTVELSRPVDPVDDVDLATDPFADDLSDQLAARAPRRYATRTTAVLAGLVLAAGGFLAGAQVQKHFGTPASGSGRGGAAGSAGGALSQNGAARAFGGRTGAGSSTGGSSAAGPGATAGTVKLVDGTTVYVQTPDGNVVTVKTNGSTSVQVTRGGALSDLAPGTPVTVEGSPTGDGVVTATKVAGSK